MQKKLSLSLLGAAGLLASASLGLTAPAAAARTQCAAMAQALEDVATKHLGSVFKGMGFDVTKKVLGVQFKVSGRAPRLTVQAAAQGDQIELKLSLSPGSVKSGAGFLKGSYDAGVFGKDSAAVSFPDKGLAATLRIPCATTCADFGKVLIQRTPVMSYLVQQLNQEFLAKLPTTVRIGSLKANLQWPTLSVTPTKVKDHLLTVKVSPWGPRWASYKSTKLSFHDDLLLKARSFDLACPLAKKTPPAVDPVEPREDTKPTCGADVDYKIHFDSNVRIIDPSYRSNKTQLDALHTYVRGLSAANCRVEIEGHTDCQGSLDFNQTLSADRARATADYMKAWSKLGSSSAGFSFQAPFCTTLGTKPMNQQCFAADAASECLTQNRRVRLRFVPTQK